MSSHRLEGSTSTPQSWSVDETDTVGVSAPSSVPETAITVGTAISRYVVLEEVGRGGMGRVLRAYDPKLQREVALKQIRRDTLDADAIGRLIAEARAMAKLSHPNVVAIYDVQEVSSGEVVLVMEYVAGQTLKTWLREEKRNWTAVVQRFREAGRGLAAAHQVGLLHRDFKPTNVLVTEQGMVKVTDFGLAKSATETASTPSIDQDGSSQDGLTEAGVVMGTPRYMAPEQHLGDPLGPAVDQYAFCVALWEALCGRAPFSGENLAQTKHEGPPPWPGSGIPKPIVRALIRGLAPRPADRWPSIEELLSALAWDPVRRRKRWLLCAGSVAAVISSAGAWQHWSQGEAQRCTGAAEQLVGIWDDARRQEVESSILGIERSYATPVWERTREQLDDYARTWTRLHTESCQATTIRGEQSADVMDLRMSCLHRARVELGAVVDVLIDADPDVVESAHELTGGLKPLARCSDVEALRAEVEPPLPADAPAVEDARVRLAAAKAASRAGRYSEAKDEVDTARAKVEETSYGPVQTEIAVAEGGVLQELGELEAAEAAYREALRLAAQHRQWEEIRRAAAGLMYVVGYQQQRFDQGLRYLGLVKGLSQDDPLKEAGVLNHHAGILYIQGKYDQAEMQVRRTIELYEKALPSDDPRIATSRLNLATIVQRQERLEEAELEHRQGLELLEKSLGPGHPNVAMARNNLANTLVSLGRFEEAEKEIREVLTLQEAALGAEHPHVAMTHDNLGNALQGLGKYEEAEAQHRRALALWHDTLGPDHPDVGGAHYNLGNLLLHVHEYEQAEAEHRAALAIWEAALGSDHPTVAMAHFGLAYALQARNKRAEADKEFQKSLAIERAAFGPDDPRLAMSRRNVAEASLEGGDVQGARDLVQQAWSRHQREDVSADERAWTGFVLARVLWATGEAGERARARSLAEDSLEVLAEAGPDWAEDVEAVRQWLADHDSP